MNENYFLKIYVNLEQVLCVWSRTVISKAARRNWLFNKIFSTHYGKTMKNLWKKKFLSFIQTQFVLSKKLQKEYIYQKPRTFAQCLGKRHIRIMSSKYAF